MNMPLAVTKSATLYAVKALTEPDEPANSGSYRPVEVVAPEGLVVNPPFGAAVVGGNHETSARVVDVVLGALSEAAPDRAVAAGTGTSGVLAYGGTEHDRNFICVEVHGCGQGAGTDCDGGNAHRVSIANTGNTPVEALESSYPLRVLSYGISSDGGGAGRHRGGCGIERRVRFEHEGWVTLTAERAVAPPYGLRGGEPAAPTRAELRRTGGDVEVLPSKTAPILVRAGDELFLKCAGGGGYGPPRERDPVLVQRDLDDGYVSPEAARDTYGVTVVAATSGTEGEWTVLDGGEPVGAKS
jgi:N-methylhydantoinase B